MATDPASGETTCKECKDKSIDRHLTLWTHQNNLLWGRLQTVSGLQLAVFAGWYATFVKGNGFVDDLIGALVTAVGLFLSLELRRLILIDIEFRDIQRDKIRKLQDSGIAKVEDLFPLPEPPKKDGGGTETMKRTLCFFFFLICVLLVVSVGKLVLCLFYWLMSGCSCW